MRSTSPATPNALRGDIQNVVSDAQELLKTVQTEGESKLSEIKGLASAQLETAKQKYGEIQQTVQDGAKLAINETDQYVHSNPWTAIGVGAAVGVVIGYLCGRAGR
jgi:ElaB/YqjD/DUF883 family membrane-anchored ribosome-binding protein